MRPLLLLLLLLTGRALSLILHKQDNPTAPVYFKGQVWEENRAQTYPVSVVEVGADPPVKQESDALRGTQTAGFRERLILKRDKIDKISSHLVVDVKKDGAALHTFERNDVNYSRYYALDVTGGQMLAFESFKALQEELRRRQKTPTAEEIMSTVKEALAEVDRRLEAKLNSEGDKLLGHLHGVIRTEIEPKLADNEGMLAQLEEARQALEAKAKETSASVGKQVQDGLHQLMDKMVISFTG